MTPAAPAETDPAPAHSRAEDLFALLNAALMMSLGLVLFREAGLVAGGTAGLAFLGHYWSGWPYGAWLLVVNLPFCVLAWRQLGRRFTLRSLLSVSVLSALSEAVPRWLDLASVQPAYAAVMGGSLFGCGLLILFRHRSSLGGFGVLALLVQSRGIMSAGRFQLLVDASIVLASLAVVGLPQVLLSVLGAVVMNLVLALNHRPGRYTGMS